MRVKQWKYTSVSLMIIWILFGCGVTEKSYRKVATDTRVTSEKKAIIAPWVSVYFPVEEGFITGEEVVKIDTQYQAFNYYDTITNTVKRVDTVKVVKETVRIDTVQKENYARVLLLRREVSLLEGEVVTQQGLRKDAEARRDQAKGNNKTLIWWVIGLGVALLASIYLHFKR